MNNFVYNIPCKVYFGENQLGHLGAELSKWGKRVLLTYGGGSIKKIGLYQAVIEQIKQAGLEVWELSGIEPNPRISSVRRGVELCKEHGIEVLLAVGGGSTIDATKIIAAGACVEHDAWDFLSEKQAPVTKALPLVSILTLSATGSEMDGAAVISNLETGDKLACISSHLLPKASFLDPTVTYSVSPYQTACGSADMLSHIFEVYFNMEKDLYMLDCFMEGLIKTIIKYTPIALADPCNYEARANLMWASSWAINGFIDGGKCLAWSCHPMEHELSAIYDITHGLGLAILTPRWMEYCLDESTVSRYVQFGENVFGLSGEPFEVAHKAIEKLSEFLFQTCGLASTFTEVGIQEIDFGSLAARACSGGYLPSEGAPTPVLQGFKPLEPKDVENIFRMCL